MTCLSKTCRATRRRLRSTTNCVQSGHSVRMRPNCLPQPRPALSSYRCLPKRRLSSPQVEETPTTSSWESGNALGMVGAFAGLLLSRGSGWYRTDADGSSLPEPRCHLVGSDPVAGRHSISCPMSFPHSPRNAGLAGSGERRTRLEFSVCGVRCWSASLNFWGIRIAAHIQLQQDADWQPVFVEQLKVSSAPA